MKKIIYTYILFVFCVFTIKAQTPFESAAFTSVLLEEKNDSLYIELDISVHSQTLHKDRSLTLIPEIAVRDNSQQHTFPRVLINGKRKGQLYRRRLAFKEKELLENPPFMRVDIRKNTDTTLLYRCVVPYENWMDSASLRIHQIFTACAGTERNYVVENRARVKIQPYIPYEPMAHINYIEPMIEVKQRDMQGEAYLDFEVGKSVILPNFRRNPVELEKIASTIQDVAGDEDITINGLEVVGYASPEGSYASNDRLSMNRAAALKEYIRQRFNIPDRMFKVGAVAEDWEGLRELVEANLVTNREQVLAIIDSSEAPDRKEALLKTMGATYRTLLNDYFPSLRRVKYRITYTVRDYSVEETSVLLQKNPAQLSLYELFKVTEQYPSDSKNWHDLIYLAVKLYPNDPIANINTAASKLIQGELEEARIYLLKAGDDPRANNNWGAYYLLTGDPDKAEEYIRKVVSSDVDGAFHNLMEAHKLRENQEIQLKKGRPLTPVLNEDNRE